MKRLLALLLLSIPLACHERSAPRRPETNGGGPRPFVTVRGERFEVGGEALAFAGVNFWPAMNLGASGPDGDRTRLLAELDHLAALGVSNLRIMASSEGPNGEPYRVTPALQTAPGEYDERLLEGLDFVLAECAKRELYAVMVLTNFWEWSGGMAQYVSWHEGSSIPYPLDTVWTDFTAYASRFYDCEPCQQMYRAHVRTIVNRVNTVNGVAYRDDPTIFAWELANEPRLYPQSWIAETASFVKGLDPDHLVTTGSEGEVGGPFVETHRSPHVDYATLHIWPQNWGWYDPQKPESYEYAEEEALKYLRDHVAKARTLGKPLVLEEFGIARDRDELFGLYDPRAAVAARNRFFAAMYAEVETSARRNGPLVGDCLWTWGGRARPGDSWIGDPPHEPPGWYSVFDSDESTLDLIRKHAAVLRTAAPER
jgi:mannan endo-1,4-beta-mannosidase